MMKKLLFVTAMAAGFGMAVSANAGEIGGAVGGAVGGVSGAVAGVSGAVGGAGTTAGGIGSTVSGSVDATVNGNASGGNIGNAGNVVSNVAHFGANANTTVGSNTSVSTAADIRNEIRQLSALDSVSSVTFVDMSTSANADANVSLGAGNAAQIQAALANNANVIMAIMAEDPDFDVSHVVGTDLRANGELVVYTN